MPKLTNKERDQQLRWLTGQIQNMNSLFASYVEWRGLSADFQKHIIDLNEKIKKKAQDDTSTDNKGDLMVKTTKSKKDDKMWAEIKPIIEKYK